jgi:hypothetical protein
MSLVEQFKILSTTDSETWNNYLELFPTEKQDIFQTPEYYQLSEYTNNGKARCFIYEYDGCIAAYPFLINSVNELGYDLEEQYYDIQGAYGYNGVITNCDTSQFINSFFNCFDNYCRQNNIIAEFIRINPLLTNALQNRKDYEIIHDRDNVYLNLLNEDIFNTAYEYSTRKNVRKAIESGLSFKSVLGNEICTLDLDSFCKIYNHTMTRNNADEFYYFNFEYFKNISVQLGKKTLFVFVLFQDIVISCELILLGTNVAYSFLGGTLSDYYQYRPNDFLKHESIKLLKDKKYHSFLLGGGSPGVFKYKKSFSKFGVIPFYIGKKIHNMKIYNEVVSEWSKRYPNKTESHKNMVLKYRF